MPPTGTSNGKVAVAEQAQAEDAAATSRFVNERVEARWGGNDKW